MVLLAFIRRPQALPVALLLSVALLPVRTGTSAAQTALSMEGGARVAALGGAGVALSGAGARINPAGPSTLNGRVVALYATQGFGVPELRLGAARYAEPLAPVGTISAGARTFGFEAYRETVFAAGLARGFALGSMARRLHAGVTARYHRLALGAASDGSTYGNAGALGFSAGLLARLVERLTLGVAATNVNGPSYADSESAGLAQTLAVGLAYRATDRLLVAADVHKDLDFPLSVRAGLEAVPVEVLAVRAGVATQPARVTAGVGLRLRFLRARLAFARHRTLGWTPAAELAMQW